MCGGAGTRNGDGGDDDGGVDGGKVGAVELTVHWISFDSVFARLTMGMDGVQESTSDKIDDAMRNKWDGLNALNATGSEGAAEDKRDIPGAMDAVDAVAVPEFEPEVWRQSRQVASQHTEHLLTLYAGKDTQYATRLCLHCGRVFETSGERRSHQRQTGHSHTLPSSSPSPSPPSVEGAGGGNNGVTGAGDGVTEGGRALRLTLLLVDDNFYYRSMRHVFYKLARRCTMSVCVCVCVCACLQVHHKYINTHLSTLSFAAHADKHTHATSVHSNYRPDR
jgi:hypothetical protein